MSTEKLLKELKNSFNAKQWGSFLESYVESYLIDRGFQLVSKGIRLEKIEIDLIMKKQKRLFVFEVKSESPKQYQSKRVSKKQKLRHKKVIEFLNRDCSDLDIYYYWAFVGQRDIRFEEVVFW